MQIQFCFTISREPLPPGRWQSAIASLRSEYDERKRALQVNTELTSCIPCISSDFVEAPNAADEVDPTTHLLSPTWTICSA